MKSEQDIGLALRRQAAHAAQVTSKTVAAFSRTFVAPTEAMAGGIGAFVGLGGVHLFGVGHPLYASVVLDACGFGGVGLACALIARLLSSRRGRNTDEQRRSELMFRASELEMQLHTLERLPSWVDQTRLDEFAGAILDTVRPQLSLPSKPSKFSVGRSANVNGEGVVRR